MYKIGDIIKVKITNILSYGAFCEFDKSSGLIHVSEFSAFFVSDIKNFVQIGDVVDVEILEYDQNKKLAKLSFKKIRVEYLKKTDSLIQETPSGFKNICARLDEWVNNGFSKKENLSKWKGIITMIKTNLQHAVKAKEIELYQEKVKSIHHMIHNKTGLGSDFLGWVEWPNNNDQDEIERMKKVANNLRKEIEILLVIGIGGSYLGARAAIDMINGLYKKDQVQIIYIGNTMSSSYTKQVLEYVKGNEFAICVVSKSGTTTEPAIAFRLFQELLETEKGKTIAKQRIIAVTDRSKGALKELANIEGYETFVIPDDIGGRYSVLTPVGLFAMLIADININNVFKGAKLAYKDTLTDVLSDNQAYLYAVGRNILYKKGYANEVLVTYELQMQMITEWWKQLFGESEGKENKAIFPASCVFSTDLHSLGQFIQEGSKVLFETVIKIETPQQDITMKANQSDLVGLNYLEGKSLHEINYLAFQGVLQAHKEEGNVANIILTFNQMDDLMFGYLSYWFMKACAMSAHLLEINPFDQPGVEVYKKNMFKLLGK